MTRLLGALLQNESGGRNILQGDIGDINNRTGDLAKGYFQITDATWRDFGGLNTGYSRAIDAPYDVQAKVAANIPLKRWGPNTIKAMKATGLPIDTNMTLGQNLAMHGEDFGTDPAAANAPTPQRPDAKSPQEAIDAAGPGSRYNVPHQGPNALGGQPAPVQGPNLPAGWQPQPQPDRSMLANLLKGGMKSFGGFASGATANQPAVGGLDLKPGPAARVSAQNVTSVDPQAAQLNDQRMQLAMMRLNSGQLWG